MPILILGWLCQVKGTILTYRAMIGVWKMEVTFVFWSVFAAKPHFPGSPFVSFVALRICAMVEEYVVDE
jgi:hypothetical protein